MAFMYFLAIIGMLAIIGGIWANIKLHKDEGPPEMQKQ